ncbi:hypothetical protein WJX74_005075 [Apatococcus lobatus]|uniref:Uncharacterized protein n=1 Tax=Apatococcus lobatus TaxID=904363 RepID=A0AAW1RZW4_9CHLO
MATMLSFAYLEQDLPKHCVQESSWARLHNAAGISTCSLRSAAHTLHSTCSEPMRQAARTSRPSSIPPVQSSARPVAILTYGNWY